MSIEQKGTVVFNNRGVAKAAIEEATKHSNSLSSSVLYCYDTMLISATPNSSGIGVENNSVVVWIPNSKNVIGYKVKFDYPLTMSEVSKLTWESIKDKAMYIGKESTSLQFYRACQQSLNKE